MGFECVEDDGSGPSALEYARDGHDQENAKQMTLLYRCTSKTTLVFGISDTSAITVCFRAALNRPPIIAGSLDRENPAQSRETILLPSL